MQPKVKFILVTLLLVALFLVGRVSITGQATLEPTERVVVILKPGVQGNAITGATVTDEEVVVITKEGIDDAQEQVLKDVNDPGFVATLFNIETEDDAKAERKLESVPAMVVQATDQGIEELENHPLVEAVYPNIDFSLTLATSGPQIGADVVHNITVNGTKLTGKGTTACVVDTGIQSDHPAFGNRVIAEKCYCAGCCVNGTSEADDATDTSAISHGTHVSGIIASNDTTYTGIAPEANIVAVKACTSSCQLADLLSALDFCVDNAENYSIDVISGSFGENGNYATQGACPTFFDTAIDAAYNKNITSVFATGNNGYANGISYPGCSPNAIGVGAVDSGDSITSWSNRGSLMEVLAPGNAINSAKIGSTYGALSGTSQATPHVSAAVLLLHQYAELTGTQITPDGMTEILKTTGSNTTGWPRIDVDAAIQSLMNPNAWNVAVVTPTNGSNVAAGNVNFTASVTGNVTVNATWYNASGVIGTGLSITTFLAEGSYNITLNATNMNQSNETRTTTVLVNVVPDTYCAVDLDQNTDQNLTLADVQLLFNNVIAGNQSCVSLLSQPTCLIELDQNLNDEIDVGDVTSLYNKFNTTIQDVYGQNCTI